MLQNILFIGATGMIGKPVAHILVEQGFEVTAMVRDPEKSAKLLHQDIALVQGDLNDITSLERAIVGQDAIYLSLSVNPNSTKNGFHTEKQGLDNLLKVIQHSSIQRIFYLSSLLQFYQSNWWVWEMKREAIKKLVRSSFPATIFYPSSFMETLVHRLLMRNYIFLIGKSTHKMFWIAAEDYAVQVANAIKLSNEYTGNMEYTIQGVEGFTMIEAVEVFKKYCNKPLKSYQFPLWAMQIIGHLHPKFAYGIHLFKALNNYHEQFNSSKTWELLGKPDISLKTYTQQFSRNY